VSRRRSSKRSQRRGGSRCPARLRADQLRVHRCRVRLDVQQVSWWPMANLGPADEAAAVAIHRSSSTTVPASSQVV
jgi:hypothetical protein